MMFLAVLLVLCGVVSGSDVIDLTDSNFKDEVNDKELILIEFFAPWCGHCKRLAPEYETAATALKGNDPPVLLAKVDCVGEGKDTCSKYGVSGYPTIKIFRGGEVSQDYDGPRDSAGIVSHMKKMAGPSSVALKDVDHLEKRLGGEDIIVIGYFSSETDLYKQFQKTADQKRSDFNFAHSLNADINKHAGHEDVIVLHRPKHLHAKFEDPKVVFDQADASVTDIKEFIEKSQAGLVGQMTQSTESAFSNPKVVAYYNIDWRKNPKGSKYYRNRVARVAKKFLDEFTFAIASRNDYARQIGDWGFQNSDEINVVAFNAKAQVFKMEQAFSVDALENFVNEFKDDKLIPYVKSESLPESNDGPVKVLVGHNFDEIVNDPSKDVLIEFYAPWCGHCKSLEPKYNELGETLKDVKDIVIAKMDATANDVPPNYEVQGFPTIYFSPMGSKDAPKKYQGGREVNDFIEYLKKEATNPFDLAKKKSKKSKKEL